MLRQSYNVSDNIITVGMIEYFYGLYSGDVNNAKRGSALQGFTMRRIIIFVKWFFLKRQ